MATKGGRQQELRRKRQRQLHAPSKEKVAAVAIGDDPAKGFVTDAEGVRKEAAAIGLAAQEEYRDGNPSPDGAFECFLRHFMEEYEELKRAFEAVSKKHNLEHKEFYYESSDPNSHHHEEPVVGGDPEHREPLEPHPGVDGHNNVHHVEHVSSTEEISGNQ
mgnify:CR=1 FL=1